MALLVKDVNKFVNKPKENDTKMADRRRDKDYIRKVIKINQKYIIICDFLDFYTWYKKKTNLTSTTAK
ncbi:hypothetical protein ES703_105468 [subsurface metagenome]